LIFRVLYDRSLALAGRPAAERWLWLLGAAEAVFFPVPPDVMLAPMCLARRAQAWRFAAGCALASFAGALIGYGIGHFSAAWAEPFVTTGRYAASWDALVAAFAAYGVWYVLVAGFSPIPFKVFTIGAGLLQMPILPFMAAVLLSRGARFMLVAALIYAGGEAAAAKLRRWIDTLGWIVVVLAVVLLYWWSRR